MVHLYSSMLKCIHERGSEFHKDGGTRSDFALVLGLQ